MENTTERRIIVDVSELHFSMKTFSIKNSKLDPYQYDNIPNICWREDYLIDVVKFSTDLNSVNLLQKCNFQLGCTLLSRNKITPRWLCIFIVISITSR